MMERRRICKGCGIEKVLDADNFGHTPSGFRNYCRTCKNKKERIYAELNPESVRKKWQKQNARRAKAGPKWTEEDVHEIRSYLKDRCIYCKAALMNGGEVDHILSLEQGETNDLSNLILACLPCNRAKGGRSPGDYLVYRLEKRLPINFLAISMLREWEKFWKSRGR